MKRNKKSENFSNVRKKQLLEANEDEDKSIHRLEKLLKLKKKKMNSEKSKKVPTMFVGDGLDYLLEVVDKKDEDIIFSDSSNDEDTKSTLISSNKISSTVRKQASETELSHKVNRTTKQRTLSELLKEKKGLDQSSDDTSSHSSDEEDSLNETSDEKDINEVNNTPDKPDLWEDIYGRIRDKSGNVVQKVDESSQLYVPPAMRNKNSSICEQKKEELLKIQRKLKGLLNRLSESNIQPICSQVEDMYMKNSRNNMNESLLSLVSELVFSAALTPSRLIMEQAIMVSLLHANVGPEVGAFFLQHLSKKFDHLLKSGPNYGAGKECNNVVVFLSHLYNFKVTGSILIFDILRCFADSFQDKDIELVQLVLKNVGFNLRKDNPLLLKEIIINIQSKASNFLTQQNDSRINFMLETLTAIRNNNMYKIPDYDPSIAEHAKKVLRSLIRKGSSLQELTISLDDLLKAEEKGRWWIVGSAWSERDVPDAKSVQPESNSLSITQSDISEKILELARKQHMNTDTRKAIFCIIMSAEDYMDAFEKLLRLNLKNQQEREIINVILHCVLQERSFNPYYAYLAGKFCTFSRKYQISFQFSLWDKFKEMTKLKQYQVNNLAHFLTHLFITGALPLSVLKVIHLSEMDKIMVSFFRKILLTILLHDSEEVCLEVFKRISFAKNLNILREGLRLFMHHFLLRDQSKFTSQTAEKLAERVKNVENVLNTAKQAFKL